VNKNFQTLAALTLELMVGVSKYTGLCCKLSSFLTTRNYTGSDFQSNIACSNSKIKTNQKMLW